MTDENKIDECMRDGEAFIPFEQPEVDYDDIEEAIKLSGEICDEEFKGTDGDVFRGVCTKMHVEVGDSDEAGIEEKIRRVKEHRTEFNGMPICEYVPIRDGMPIGDFSPRRKREPRLANKEELEQWNYVLSTDGPEAGSIQGDGFDGTWIKEWFPVELWPDGVWPALSPVFMVDSLTGEPVVGGAEAMAYPEDRIKVMMIELFKLDMTAPVPLAGDDGVVQYSRSQRRDFVEAAIDPMKREGIKYLHCLKVSYKDGKLCVWARGAK